MTLRVVHVASGREWRGGQNQVRLLATALAQRDDVRQLVVTGRGSELARRLAAAGVPVRPAGWRGGLDPRALAATVRAALERPHMLHAHDAHALVLAGLASAVTGVPFVVSRRVDFHLRRPGFWARAARVVAISDAVRRVLLEDGLPGERVAVVHSGIAPEEVRAAPAAGVRGRLGLGPADRLAVNVAALVGHKDQATLVRAAAHLHPAMPDLHWAVCGEGPYRPALEAQITGEGLGHRVHLMGQVSNPLGTIREADVFVMSSREEGLGTSVLDALALDVPVVATRGGGIPEMLDGGAGRLVPVGDAAALAGEVRRVLTEPGCAEALRAAGRQRLEAFTHTRMAAKMLQVYRSITGNDDTSP